VAALNVARVPGYTVSVLGVVLLPAVSRAVARGDTSSVRWYVRRAMRLLLLLYLPASLVLVREPDAVMRWIYSEPYGGGGTVLAILLVAQGGWVAHTVLAWVLVAAGETRKLSILMAAVVLLAAPLTVVLVTAAGSLGAATAYGLSGAGAATALAVLLQRRFGSVLPLLPLARIAVAGAAMFIVSVLVIDAWHPLARAAASLGVYAAVLVLLAEITWDDVAAIAAPEAAERRR
jgi:O-antigen/teichoic acid export membrane protein